MQKSILVVDDDPVSLSLLSHLVEKAGHQALTASRPSDACRLAYKRRPDAALVDLNLGADDGLDLVRRWRVEDNFPVLIISARGEPVDRIIGLEMGAADYITKPFEPRELQLRLRIALDRSECRAAQREAPSRWAIGSTIFDAAIRAICAGSEQVRLTTAEFRLIDLLVRHPNQVVTRDRIMDSVHQRSRHFATDRSVDMMVARLRSKTREIGLRIEAIRGSGYMLCASVERIA